MSVLLAGVLSNSEIFVFAIFYLVKKVVLLDQQELDLLVIHEW
jgi:hypothetical protein